MLKKILCFNAQDKCKAANVPGRRTCLSLTLETRQHQVASPAAKQVYCTPFIDRGRVVAALWVAERGPDGASHRSRGAPKSVFHARSNNIYAKCFLCAMSCRHHRVPWHQALSAAVFQQLSGSSTRESRSLSPATAAATDSPASRLTVTNR